MAEDPQIAAANEERKREVHLQLVLLREVVTRILKRKAKFREINKPEFLTKPIIEFRRRMRVSSLERFESTTYIASINFCRTNADLSANKALGAVIVFVEEKNLGFLLQRMDYPMEDNDNLDELKDACGTICNLICGNFKSGLVQLDYQELVMSHFSSFQNEAPFGIDYDQQEKNYYEMTFNVEEHEKLLTVVYTMGAVPKFGD
jgi:hypothetical protein